MTLQQALAPFAAQYSAAFLRAIAFVLPWEAVFRQGRVDDWSQVIPENVSGDPGGVTKYGIDKASHPEFDIANLTLTQALAIYYSAYWKKQNCDAFPAEIGLAVFDAGINVGTVRAGKWLQKAIGLPTANQDGVIGPATLNAFNNYVRNDPVSRGNAVLRSLLATRTDYYADLGATKQFRKFRDGWMNRMRSLRVAVNCPANGTLPA